MNPNIYLITAAEVISDSTLFTNVEEKFILPAVQEAQKFILNVVGTGLYNQIEAQVNLSALTSDNQTLFNSYIKPTLTEYVIFELIEDIHFKLSPTGVQVMRPNDTDPAGERGVDRMKNRYKVKAERRANDLRNFLIANSSTYPLYYNAGSSYDTVNPSQNPYFSGMYLGDGTDDYSINKDIIL